MRTPVAFGNFWSILLHPKKSLVVVVVGNEFASTFPESDVVQIGLCQLQIGEGDGIAVNGDVPFVSDVFQSSNLAHGLEYTAVAEAMRRLYAETFWLT